jgi:hypothetical protein
VPGFVRINGALAEIVPLSAGRAKLVYLASEPEDRLPTEIEYAGIDLGRGERRQRVVLKSSNVLLVERVEPDLGDSFDPRKLIPKLLAKFRFKRHAQRPSE